MSLGVRRAEAGSSVPIPWCPVAVTAPAGGGGGGRRGVFCSAPFRDRDWSLSVSRGLERGVSVHLGLAGNFLRP